MELESVVLIIGAVISLLTCFAAWAIVHVHRDLLRCRRQSPLGVGNPPVQLTV